MIRRIALVSLGHLRVDWITRSRGCCPARWRERVAIATAVLIAGAAPAHDAFADGLERAVGRVNVAGRSFCTGTLIEATRAITAAHCLFDSRTGAQAPLRDIHFVAGWDRGRYVAHAQPIAVRIAVGYVWQERRSLASLERDLAILEFDKPVAAPRLAIDGRVPAGEALALVHYSHSRPHLAARDDGCRRLGGIGRLWWLDCAIEPGGSGAPILVTDEDAPRLAAVALGRTRHDGVWVTLALPITSPALLP